MIQPAVAVTRAARYPSRPSYFAHKFIRLMGKVCLANEIGADACWLLSNVAILEDAKGYCGAVTFFNGQLMPFVGVNSDEALVRIRRRAVDAGWLHYEHGAKGVAGRYWVTIPSCYDRVDDLPSDENPAEYRDLTPADTTAKTRMKAKGKPRESGVESQGKAKDNSGSFFPVLILSCPEDLPEAETPPPAVAGQVDPVEQKPRTPRPPAAVATDPHSLAVVGFCSAWQKRYGEKYPFAGGKDGAAVKAMLAHVDHDVPKFLAIVARYLADSDPFYAADGRHGLAKLRMNFSRWLALAKPPPLQARGDRPDL